MQGLGLVASEGGSTRAAEGLWPGSPRTGRWAGVRAEVAGLKLGPIRQAQDRPLRQAQGRFYAGGDAGWENGGGHIGGTVETA